MTARLAHVSLALWLLVSLLACRAEPGGAGLHAPLAGEARVAPAKELRVLLVGTSGDYAPFSLDGAGFDVEVAHLLARELGAEIEWVPFRWPELAAQVAADRFDVAMSGVTWRPSRSVVGTMSLAVASGGPCVLGDPDGPRIGVNRGGVLERWARARFAKAEIRAVDGNAGLPEILASSAVDAIVTDSFELPHFRLPGSSVRCEPARDRKVYWVAPASAATLGPEIDAFLREHEPRIDALRARYLGGRAPRTEADHLVDLVARRLELMPAVAAWKRRNDRPIEDPAREQRVLAAIDERAREVGLEPKGVRRLFALQIELAKAVQRRSADTDPELDLERELRPALVRLGERIVASLARAAPLADADLDTRRLDVLGVALDEAEIERVRVALLEVRPAS